MKKLLKWAGVTTVILFILLIVGIIALPLVFPLEKIKDFATAKLSETIHRDVKIEKVSFNLFSGIKLKGLTISQRAGQAKTPFIKADSINLRYAFWPLFTRQIIIQEIALVKPEILIEKTGGQFNFSDLTTMTKTTQPPKPAAKPPFDLFISSFTIKSGKIIYVDHNNKTTSEIKNFNFSLSGFALALVKPINLSASADLIYQGKTVPLSLAGQIAVDISNEIVKIPNLSFNLAGEKAALSATIANLRTGPEVKFNLSSTKLTIDPLLAIFASAGTTKQPKAQPGELTKMIAQLTAAISGKLQVNGEADLNNLTFQGFKVETINLSLKLANKVLTVDLNKVNFYHGLLTGNFNADLNALGLSYGGKLALTNFEAHPFANSVVETFLTKLTDYKELLNKVYGTIDLNLTLSGRGVEVSDIMANANASGSFSLKNGELKKLKIMESLAAQLKSPALKQDLQVSELSSNFTFRDQLITLAKLTLRDHDLNVFFAGGLDLKSQKYVAGNRLTLKGSPSLTKDLPKEYNLLRDNKGWLAVTFELKGSLKMPIPTPILDKPIEAAVGKLKIKVEAAKVEVQQKAQQAIDQESVRLQDEAKQKLQDEAKKLLSF
jgi:uncharacterized protein involved in outer membrane biogenesis